MPVKDIVDGFVLSGSQLYLTENYRANVLAQMEVLRRATAYRCREYVVPKQGVSVPAYSQVEQAITVQPGSYVWGVTWSAPFGEAGGNEGSYVYVQITDACTETAFFSDYTLCEAIAATAANTSLEVVRNPTLFSQPRLIGAPGKIDVELYNSYSAAITCQLVILVAEPAITPDQMNQYFEQQRIEGML